MVLLIMFGILMVMWKKLDKKDKATRAVVGVFLGLTMLLLAYIGLAVIALLRGGGGGIGY
jgi:cadmium resistance protein CadD (predicted permease)